MINLAAHVQDLSPSQKSFYLIKNFNSCIDNTDLSPAVFHNRNCIPPKHPFFACMMSAFMSSYNGCLVSTTLEEAQTILKICSKADRYLYLWDFEWLEKPVHFDKAMDVLRDDKLKLIARSHEHAKHIRDFCNKEVVAIVDNWNIDQLLEIVNG